MRPQQKNEKRMRHPWIVLVSLLLFSCSAKRSPAEEGQAKDSALVPARITEVVGIGKVEPEAGIVHLAAEVGGIVKSVALQAGDRIKKGGVILTLAHTDAALKVRQIKKQMATQQQQVEADRIATGQYRLQLQEKTSILSTSEKLLQSGAETRQNVQKLRTDIKVLQVQLAKSEKAVAIGQSKLAELRAQWRAAEHTLEEKTIKAPADGVVLHINVEVGSAIQPLESFGTFAAKGPLVVHGEADELFANRLAIGQKVSIHHIGAKQTITTGTVSTLAPALSNKSLFTDVPGELQDRRVRRFKVRLDSTANLLINTKVACTIYLKNARP